MKKLMQKKLFILLYLFLFGTNLISQTLNPLIEIKGISLLDSSCGSSITGLTLLYVDMTNSANNYAGIQNFRYEVKDLKTNESLYIIKPFVSATNGNFFTLNDLSTIDNTHFVKTNNGYSLRIQAQKNGIWGEFGKKCTFYTRPLIVKNTNSQNPSRTARPEGSSVGWYAQFYSTYPSPYCISTESRIMWKITKSSEDNSFIPAIATVNNADGQFLMAKIVNNNLPYNPANNINNVETFPNGFITNGANYCFELAMVYPDGSVGEYNSGSSCYKYIGQNGIYRMSNIVESDKDFEVFTSPNPSKDSFDLNVTTSSKSPVDVIVYDINGRVIETKKYSYDMLSKIEIGNNYSTGIYNMTVSQDENKKTLKLIKE